MSAAGSEQDRDAFEATYASTRVAILGYLVRRSPDPADAADLLAETYLVAWRRAKDVPEGEAALMWLYGVARRVLANHHRHRHVEARLASSLRAQLQTSLTFRTTAAEDTAMLSAAVDACLREFNPQDREILELTAYEELTPAEIAAVTGKSPGAVRVRLHRARKTLRLRLLLAGFSIESALEPSTSAPAD